CYADLNHFKSFNDHYGYWKGDELLKGAAAILAQACDPARDFLGHIGGDDYLVLFQGDDWEARIHDAMARFNDGALAMYAAADRMAGGIQTEDRHGRPMFFPPVTMAVGAVRVGADAMATWRLGSQHVGTAAAVAKRRAKGVAQKGAAQEGAAQGIVCIDIADLAARGELDS
ncbi:MAG: diguanylate cyclase, partial [Cupriavidus sp.]|nr:diguanylate cyclase [Cupriavidus sp.]